MAGRRTRADKTHAVAFVTEKAIRKALEEYGLEPSPDNVERALAAILMCAQVGADHALEELHLHLSGYYE